MCSDGGERQMAGTACWLIALLARLFREYIVAVPVLGIIRQGEGHLYLRDHFRMVTTYNLSILYIYSAFHGLDRYDQHYLCQLGQQCRSRLVIAPGAKTLHHYNHRQLDIMIE